MNSFGFILSLLALGHIVGMLVYITHRLTKTEPEKSNRIIFLKAEIGDSSGPNSRQRNTLLLYLVTKMIAVIVFLSGNSNANLALYGIILAAYIVNDIVLLRDLKINNVAVGKNLYALTFVCDLFAIMLYVCTFVIEKSKSIATLSSTDVSQQLYVSNFLMVFIIMKFLLTSCDVILNFKSKRDLMNKYDDVVY